MSPAHDKRGGKRRSSDRVTERLEPGQRFLIVCEGECTEKLYFEAFPLAREMCSVKVFGRGRNTTSLVRYAIEMEEQAKIPYDQVWCVFDRDSYTAEMFNAALDLARKRGYKVAYSNEAFELWFLLHFNYCDNAISRQTYCQRLSDAMYRPYDKTDPGMYARLYTLQAQAIRRAKRLLQQYDPPDPARDNPSTTVFRLVEALNQFLIENRVEALKGK